MNATPINLAVLNRKFLTSWRQNLIYLHPKICPGPQSLYVIKHILVEKSKCLRLHDVEPIPVLIKLIFCLFLHVQSLYLLHRIQQYILIYYTVYGYLNSINGLISNLIFTIIQINLDIQIDPSSMPNSDTPSIPVFCSPFISQLLTTSYLYSIFSIPSTAFIRLGYLLSCILRQCPYHQIFFSSLQLSLEHKPDILVPYSN